MADGVFDECGLSERVDGPWHSWLFDGDGPYIRCAYCREVRDAIDGRVIIAGAEAPGGPK